MPTLPVLEQLLGRMTPFDPLLTIDQQRAGLAAAMGLSGVIERGPGLGAARRLAEAGVRATVTRWPGMLHGTNSMTAALPEAAEWRDACSRALAEAVRPRGTGSGD